MFLRGCCASSSFVSVKISDFPLESVQTRYYFSDKLRPLGTCFVSSFQTSLDFVTLYPFFSFLAMSRVFLSFTSRGKCGILRSKIYRIILFENLFKPRQLRLAVDMVTDFVSSIHNLKTVFWADFVSLIYNLKAVLWATCGSLPSLLFDFHWV